MCLGGSARGGRPGPGGGPPHPRPRPQLALLAALCRRPQTAPRSSLSTPGNGAAAAVNPQLLEVLQSVATGVLTPGDGAVQLGQLVQGGGGGAEGLAKANFPEVVWGEHKTAAQIATSLQRIADAQGMGAATRVAPDVAADVAALLPGVAYSDAARMLTLKSATTKQHRLPGSVALICAGTADAGVVEECRLMLQNCGCYSFKLAESGVMGMHRCAVRAARCARCVADSVAAAAMRRHGPSSPQSSAAA